MVAEKKNIQDKPPMKTSNDPDVTKKTSKRKRKKNGGYTGKGASKNHDWITLKTEFITGYINKEWLSVSAWLRVKEYPFNNSGLTALQTKGWSDDARKKSEEVSALIIQKTVEAQAESEVKDYEGLTNKAREIAYKTQQIILDYYEAEGYTYFDKDGNKRWDGAGLLAFMKAAQESPKLFRSAAFHDLELSVEDKNKIKLSKEINGEGVDALDEADTLLSRIDDE